MSKKLIITARPTYTHEAGPDQLKALGMPGIEEHPGDVMPYVDEVLAKAGYAPGTKVKVSIVGEDGTEIKSWEPEIL